MGHILEGYMGAKLPELTDRGKLCIFFSPELFLHIIEIIK